ncbi:asparagine synthase (glutamine-hydrolyzing) [Ignavibacteria bacterium]
MCGIVGIVEQSNRNSSISEDILRSMSDVISHRGPDDEGQWISSDRRCGLAFRRLSIIDLSPAGHQPMSSPDGRFTIVFNGEIYNHSVLRAELESKGYIYRSRTDTETILYGYKEWGVALLSKMTGMWDLAIWDDERKELFCARDRVGIKPLYYTHRDGRFIFGSEIKSILQHNSTQRAVNWGEAANYLCFSMSGNRSTMFENIHKLPAGHFAVLKSDNTLKIERYWSPLKAGTSYTTMSEPEIVAEIMRLLRQAVKDRMMSDVPFGVFLSGGIDSSANVALMAELMNRPIDTFSVGFKELEKYNEMQYARKIASVFNTNHHEILIDHNDALPMLETLVWHEDEPNGDPVCIPLYFLSKLTRESGTTVIQVGEGSDEQFVGYPWMIREYKFYNTYWKFFSALPRFVRSLAYSAAKPILSARGQFLALDYIRRGAEGDELYWGGAVDMPPAYLREILKGDAKNSADFPIETCRLIHNQIKKLQSKPSDIIQRMALFELTHRLPELLLMRVDKMTMAHSLEARVPFLDHRLVEFTMTIPPALKLPNLNETKRLLKKGVADILPHDIIHRRKQGFAAPMAEWLRGPWRNYTEQEIMNSQPIKLGLLDRNTVKTMLARHNNGAKNYGKSIYSLLNLALWWKRFM